MDNNCSRIATAPMVSVVVPTANRADLLLRAVRSVFAQTVDALELIVVVDGPCHSTMNVLNGIQDSRLRVIVNERGVGAAESRNRGVRAASAQWIAFLDDDDEWLPEKLRMQLEAARASRSACPVVTGRVFADGPWGRTCWPRRFPRDEENLGEYLFVRRSATQGEAFLPTTTFLARRSLLMEVPFASDLPRHQEWDWLLRVTTDPTVTVEWVKEPIAIYNVATDRSSISRNADWRFSLRWMKNHEANLTPRARAGFIATVVAGACRKQSDRAGIGVLCRELVRAGCCNPIQWTQMLTILLMPAWVRTIARATAR